MSSSNLTPTSERVLTEELAKQLVRDQGSNVIIPDTYTTIGEFAFAFNQLTSVTIPDSITTIGARAFEANSLMSLDIGDSVVTIGERAFGNNPLVIIDIPDSVIAIGNDAFAVCNITTVDIGNSVTSIGDYAFGVNRLSNVYIPDNVKSIGVGAFEINQLTSVSLPYDVEYIGGGAFGYNPNVVISRRDPEPQSTPELNSDSGLDCSDSTDIFRFYNSVTGVHFFTPSTGEKDDIISKPEWGYKYEGVAYKAPSDTGAELYRFYNRDKGYHFLTANKAEADSLTGKPEWGYKYEGRSYKVTQQATSETPNEVYRFYNRGKGIHFYSASDAEANNIIANSLGSGYDLSNALKEDDLLPNGWGYVYEGAAWYVTDC